MEPTIEMKDMDLVYRRPSTLTDTPMHYCPGCGHGVAHKLIAEVIDEIAATLKSTR